MESEIFQNFGDFEKHTYTGGQTSQIEEELDATLYGNKLVIKLDGIGN